MIKPILPERFKGGVTRYFKEKIEPGGFLTAVLRNDLAGALGRADPQSIEELPGLVFWLTYYAPRCQWGSKENVKRHLGGT